MVKHFDMDFRTVLQPQPHPGLITHRRGILTLGSCFADNIAARLADDMFPVLQNPFGTLYNPGSVYQGASRIALGEHFDRRELFEHLGRWRSWNCHTLLTDTDPDALTARLNDILDRARQFVGQAAVAILTFGTARVFRLKDSGRIVANCHKMPSDSFQRLLLNPDQCVMMINATIDALRRVNPDITVIMTVSPVRHLADGAHGNFISKATLALAVEQALADNDRTFYFPSFEIMNDDLRDYRFYADDMVHPSPQAIDYIYDRFAETYFDTATRQLALEARKISRRKQHRPTDTTDPAEFSRFQEETDRLERQLLSRLRP